MVKNGKTRKQKSQETKMRIFNASIKLFKDHGYENVSVNDIISQSKTSVGSFYHYFNSKDELVLTFLLFKMEQDYESYRTDILNSNSYADKNALEKLLDFVVYSQEATHDVGEEFLRISYMHMMSEATGFTAYNFLLAPDRSFAAISKDLIKEGQEEGVIRTDKSVEELFEMIDLINNGANEKWYMSRGKYPSKEAFTAVIEELLQHMFTVRC